MKLSGVAGWASATTRSKACFIEFSGLFEDSEPCDPPLRKGRRSGFGGPGGARRSWDSYWSLTELNEPALPPPGGLESTTIRITFGPALRFTPVLVTFWKVLHPPVSGKVRGPVTSTPSNSTWNVPPPASEATWTVSV